MYEFPKPKKMPTLRKKSDSLLMKLLSLLLFFAPGFMKNFWTTLHIPFVGTVIYVPTIYDADADWGSEDWQFRHEGLIQHECVHVWRNEKWSAALVAVMYVGPAPFVFLASLLGMIWCPYAQWGILVSMLLLPLSVGFAYGRWFIEREAYMAQILRAPDREIEIERIVQSLWTSYLATWPRDWMRSWFEKEAVRLDG